MTHDLGANSPRFLTERCSIDPLMSEQVGRHMFAILQDRQLVNSLPWVADKTIQGVHREANLAELQCAAGVAQAWSIVDKAFGNEMGIVLIRDTPIGLDVEILCRSKFWHRGIGEEVAEPIAEWLEYDRNGEHGGDLLLLPHESSISGQ